MPRFLIFCAVILTATTARPAAKRGYAGFFIYPILRYRFDGLTGLKRIREVFGFRGGVQGGSFANIHGMCGGREHHKAKCDCDSWYLHYRRLNLGCPPYVCGNRTFGAGFC